MTKIDRNNFRVIKITSLREMEHGKKYFAEIHDAKGTLFPVEYAEFNTEKPIKSWNQSDYVTMDITGRGEVVFKSHTMSGPKYPVTRITKENGKSKNYRVTFYVAISDNVNNLPVVVPSENTDNIIDAEFCEVVVEHEREILMLAAPERISPQKPVKSDYDTFPAWMAACRKYKKELKMGA